MENGYVTGNTAVYVKRGRPKSFELQVKLDVKKHKCPAAKMPVKDVRLDGLYHWSEYRDKDVIYQTVIAKPL